MHQTVDVFCIVAGLLYIAFVGALINLVPHLAFAGIVSQMERMLDHVVAKLIV